MVSVCVWLPLAELPLGVFLRVWGDLCSSKRFDLVNACACIVCMWELLVLVTQDHRIFFLKNKKKKKKTCQ